ncbi:MAG: hypothetical protein UHP25_05265, partial [Prevotella sp.]|nr:hypothetical protein [Prevotella sp.]
GEKTKEKSNVFVKPNEQNKARFNSAMARKRRRNPTFSLSQMSRIKLALILPWRENEGEIQRFR